MVDGRGEDLQDRLPTLVRRGDRVVGAFAADERGRLRWHPVVDVEGLVTRGVVLVGVGLVSVCAAVAARRRPAVQNVSMGPGGWVSVRSPGPVRARTASARHRPWWAHLLRARPLRPVPSSPVRVLGLRRRS